MASASVSSSEQEGLLRRAWATLVPVRALLLRRLADNTLLPGTNKEEEVMYFTRSQAIVRKARECLSPPKRTYKAWAMCLDTKLVCAPCFIRSLCLRSYEAVQCRVRVRTPLF